MIFDMILALAIIGVAIYGICVSDNIIKSIICFNIVQAALILLFILLAGYSGDQIPIITEATTNMVDPLPQALMITAIVISASITALALMFSVKIFHYYGTLSWTELSEKDVSK
ncbi:MAG: cation:proton antiporter subunit C [Clostridiales bacterium]|nr:cation:proton antiporter subunit C [Clostridiales bacterium]